VTPYDEDETPAQVWLQLQRERAAQRNFVAAPAPLAKAQPITIDAPAWMVQQQQQDLTRALETADGAQERTSAMDRAKALRVRLLPFVGLWALMSVIVFVVVLMVAQNAPGAALLALLAFTALTAYTYYRLNRTDYDYSREGTERHKVDTTAYLVERQMDHEQELRRMALDAYLQVLERNEGGR
jgi:Flp pilus assembly protein TadB